MKKGLLLLMAVFMAFGVAMKAAASTRLDGMSADARAVEDQDLIWNYPNKALQYKNSVEINLNNSDTYYYSTWDGDNTEWGGILKDAGDIGVIGLYTGRPFTQNLGEGYYDTYNGGDWWQETVSDWTDWLYYSAPLYGAAWSPIGGTYYWNGENMPENKLDLFWAKSYSDLDLGVRLNYGDYQDYVTNAISDSRVISGQIGVGINNLAPFNEANFHFGFGVGSVDDGTVKDNGIYSFSAGALLVADMGGDDSLRLYGDATLDQFALQGSNSAINNDMLALLGAAVNHKLGKGFVNSSLTLAYGGGTWKYDTAGTDYNTNYWDVIWNVSFETPLSGWLTYRAGLTRMVFERYYSRTGTAAASYGDDWLGGNSNLNMGLTANVENLTIDALLNVGAIEQFLGSPSLNNLFIDDYNTVYSGPGPLSMVEVDLKAKI